MSEFTKGPWSVCDHAINDHWYVGTTIGQIDKDSNGEAIGGVRIGDACVLNRNCEANAHLIAAAPDMFAELEHCYNNPLEDPTRRREIVAEILAKARGESK